MPCNFNCNQGRRCCGCYIADQGLHRHDGPFHHHEPVPAQEELFTWLDGLFASAQRIALGAFVVAAVIALVIWLASTWPVAYAVAVLVE